MGKTPDHKEIELEPDAWQRFEHAVDVVAKSPPQHKTKGKPKANQKKRATKRKSKQNE
jgi:hypothetical protein